MALATLEDFETRHGDVPEAEHEKVEQLLEDASSLILDQVTGSTEDWTLEEGNPPNSVIRVCCAAAYRAWTNPQALSRQTLGQSTFTYKGDQPDALYLTEREVRTVQQAGKRKSFQAVTLESPYSGDTDSDSIFDNDLVL